MHHHLSLIDLPNPLLQIILEYIHEANSLFRLSWTCRSFRRLTDDDQLWRQLLVDNLNNGIDGETCDRLCELSCLDCRSLAMAVVAARQTNSHVHSYAQVKATVDPRTLGIISFRPGRIDVNDSEAVQQACVDAIRWCLATTTDNRAGQFLWEGRSGRADLLVSYSQFLSECGYEFHLEGEAVWVYQDRDVFLQDANDNLQWDCLFIALDSDAPTELKWMNSDYRIDGSGFDSVQDTISDEPEHLETIIKAHSGFTLGIFYGGTDNRFGTNFHYRSAIPGSKARKLFPMAQYALECEHIKTHKGIRAILSDMFKVAVTPDNFLGYPMGNDADPVGWTGWPFGGVSYYSA